MIVGYPQIHTDTIVFRDGEKVYELPTYGVVGVFAHSNGLYYEAKLKDIKKFLRERKNG